MEDKICYIEDETGGLLCYSKDKEFFMNRELNSVLCCEGTKEEVEGYLDTIIRDEEINILGNKACLK